MLWNVIAPKPSWCSRVIQNKYFPGPRLRCLKGDSMKKKGTMVYKLCKKSLPQFLENLYWIPGNGKMISIWQDVIQGKPPPNLPRLNNWMNALGYKILWDISEWELERPNRWTRWALPNCSEELMPEKDLLLNHLAGLAPVSKTKKDRCGWGRAIGRYTATEGYQSLAMNYNVPINPAIWNYLWKR